MKNPGTVFSKCFGHYLPFTYSCGYPLPGGSSSMNTTCLDVEKSGSWLCFFFERPGVFSFPVILFGHLNLHNSCFSFSFSPTVRGIHCQMKFWIWNQVIFILQSLCNQILAHQYFPNGNFSASHFWYIYTFDLFPKRRSPSAYTKFLTGISPLLSFCRTLQHSLTIFIISHSLHLICFDDDADFFITTVGYDFLVFSF